MKTGIFILNGAPGRARTLNLQIRSLLLYPIELRTLDVDI